MTNPSMTAHRSGLAALPVGPHRFVALDVETASSDPASICQIGLACVTPGGQVACWSTYVNPGTPFSPFNTQLHGIGPAQVRSAPRFAEVIVWLEAVLAAQPVIQHSSFDRRAFQGACAAMGREAPAWVWGDSVRIARKAWPEFTGHGGHGLAHLKTRLGLRFEHHDAGEDARAAAEVVLHAEARTGVTFEALLGWLGHRG